jgi:hypothetical protein
MAKTHQDFIKDAEHIHGIGRYQYLSTYVKAHAPMLMRCTICGTHFSQKPNSHLNGCGCRKCGYAKNREELHLTLADVVAKARQMHGDSFHYPGPYLGAQSKMPIICPVHGTFYQRPAEHYRSPAGCPKCSYARSGIVFSSASPDLSGRRFGKLLVTGKNGVKWKCLCDCGKTIEVKRKPLSQGKKLSCGVCRRGSDLTGKSFGRLTVVQRDSAAQQGNGKCVKWVCQCRCGVTLILDSHALTRKDKAQRSCGCLQRDTARISPLDLTGSEFGRLRVVKRQGSKEKVGGATWFCECSCGSGRDVIASTGSLRSGGIKSCGCLSHSPCVIAANATDNLYLVQFVDRNTGESFLKVGRTIYSVDRRYHGRTMYGHLERYPLLVMTDLHDKIATVEFLITGKRGCHHAAEKESVYEFRKHKPEIWFHGATECFNMADLVGICMFIGDYFPCDYQQRIGSDDCHDDRWPHLRQSTTVLRGS